MQSGNRGVKPKEIGTVTVWSVCLSVCVLVTLVSPAKTAESMEITFGID